MNGVDASATYLPELPHIAIFSPGWIRSETPRKVGGRSLLVCCVRKLLPEHRQHGVRNIPVRDGEIRDLDKAPLRPARIQLRRYSWFAFSFHVLDKTFDPRDCAHGGFQHRPVFDEVGQAHVEVHDGDERHADKADIRLLGESDGQSHKHDRQAGDDEVQHEVDPQLDAEEEVEGSLGEVE